MRSKQIPLFFFLLSFFVLVGCTNNNDRKSAPPPNPTRNDNISPAPESQWPSIELPTEDAQLTLPAQQFRMNSISETNADKIGNFYKKFILHSNSKMKITLDHELTELSQCQLPLKVDYEVILSTENSANSIKINLKKEPSFIIEAQTFYSITVRVGNNSRCKNIHYGFALIADDNSDNKKNEPTKAELPESVVCISKDQIGREQLVEFDFIHNEILLKDKNSNVSREVFSRTSACLFKPKELRSLDCISDYQFDGSLYSKSLACTATKKDSISSIELTSGRTWFRLSSGEGRLDCNVFSISRLQLNLTECKAN